LGPITNPKSPNPQSPRIAPKNTLILKKINN